jgi:hypothetical protein
MQSPFLLAQEIIFFDPLTYANCVCNASDQKSPEVYELQGFAFICDPAGIRTQIMRTGISHSIH